MSDENFILQFNRDEKHQFWANVNRIFDLHMDCNEIWATFLEQALLKVLKDTSITVFKILKNIPHIIELENSTGYLLILTSALHDQI